MILSTMLDRFTSEEKCELPLQFSQLENKHRPYVYGVIIPYSSNLRDPNTCASGTERLSFYSAFAINAAIEMHNNGLFQKFILFSDATFGKERKSTGTLMKEALLRTHSVQRIQESDIILLDADYLNNTPAQIEELAKYIVKNNLLAKQCLVVCWGFHQPRICKYMEGFGITMDVMTVEEAHKYYNSKFKPQILYQILPKAFERREKKLRLLTYFDKRGVITKFLKRLTGPVVTDIQKVEASHKQSSPNEKVSLIFDNLSGKKKLYQLKKNVN